jgi:hypothetical protein
MVFDIVDIRIPSVRLISIYSILSARRRIMLPFTGNPNTNHDKARIRSTFIKDRIK